MREYEVRVVEKMESSILVYAEDEDQAYEEAMEIMAEDFNAPYHDSIEVQSYTVKPTGKEED